MIDEIDPIIVTMIDHDLIVSITRIAVGFIDGVMIMVTIVCVAAVDIAVAEIHRVVCDLGHDGLSRMSAMCRNDREI